MSTQKILFVAHGHPDLSAGGAEIAAYTLYSGMKEINNIEPFFMAWTDNAEYCNQHTPYNIFKGRDHEFVYYSNTFTRFTLSQPSLYLLDQFTLFLQKIDPDVIHFHHYVNIGIEFITLARKFKKDIRIFVTLHEYMAICHHYGLMVKTKTSSLCYKSTPDDCSSCFSEYTAEDFVARKDFIQSHFSHVDLFISPSYFLKQRYVAWGLPECKIVVAENALQQGAAITHGKYIIKRPRTRFGFFGQMHPFKGLMTLLLAFNYIRNMPRVIASDISLFIHGSYLDLNEQSYIDAINQLLDRTSEHVTFIGPYHRDDLPRLMADVDWVVVPSIWWENSPLVIQEALFHRRPIICSDLGGMKEHVRHGLDGLLFSCDDYHHLAQIILSVSHDDRLWEQLQLTMRHPTTAHEVLLHHLAIYEGRCRQIVPDQI